MKLLTGGKDISQLIEKITWSGDTSQVSRKINFTIAQNKKDTLFPNVSIDIGDEIIMQDNEGNNIFGGIIFDADKKGSSKTVSYLAYDLLFYVNQSDVNMVFSGTPESIVTQICQKLDIPCGELAPTNGVVVKSPCFGKKAYKAIMMAYTVAARKNGTKYIPLIKNINQLCVIEKGTLCGAVMTGDYNLIDTEYKSTLQNLVNRVIITNSKGNQIKVIEDAVNSVGGIVIPKLLRELGCEVVELNCEPTGEFAHNPEPLPENLTEISKAIVREKADLGVVVDPDVDRLAFVSEDGSMFVEEYTLVAVADYILSRKTGNTVSNLSSSRALSDVTQMHGGEYFASAVGEVNVVAKMKEVGAVIGGEGNGGVIYPELHYGRDALVGAALFLTYLAEKGMTMTELRKTYPAYFASKNKIELTPAIDVDKVLREMKSRYANEKVNDADGVKIDFPENWVHLRKSNTEPIIRVYTEAKTMAEADALARRIIAEIKQICNI